jgi:glycosyltransferase involved in cell wall biosynthesis
MPDPTPPIDSNVRKVLLVTYHFPPSGAVAVHRMLGLVRYLPKFGWQPIVVAPPRVPWEPEDASLLEQVPAGTVVERVPFPSGFLGKVARYLSPDGHWLWKARVACRRVIREHRPAAIITSSPPGCVHLAGLRMHHQFGLPWLADFRDPWVTNAVIPRWSLGWRWERWQEAKVMRQATALIANTPLNERGWAAAFPDLAGKIVTITNGFDPERFVASPRPHGQPLTILHAGELYHERDPRPLLDALRDLQAQGGGRGVQLEFLGRLSGHRFDLAQEVRDRSMENAVHIAEMVPYTEALERMMRADILLIVNSPGYRIGVPAKLYEYLGAGRAILALAELDSDIAWVLRESGVLHRIAPPLDVPRIKQAVVELVEAVQSGVPAVPNPAALEQFTRERMARKFAECLDRSVVTP